MKTRILYLITGLEVGGAEMMLLKTLPKMKNNFDQRVCCIKGFGPIGEKLKEKGIQVYYLDLKNIFDFGIIKRFREILKDFKPDILITCLIHADIFGRIFGRIFKIKKIVCSVRVKLIQTKYLPLLFLDALTSPLVTHYHFNSEAVSNMYNKFLFLPRRKITVIANGLEAEKYNVEIDKERKKQELGLPKDKIIIGCVARLRKQKGHKYLVSAFAKLAKKNEHVFLVFIGDGSEKKNIEQQLNELSITEKIIFLGNRNDIPEILKVIDIFVLPTLFEGMSNALLEAMASGLPIIATNIPENKELISDEKEGLLVSTRSSDSIATAMEKLIKNKVYCQNIGKNAKEKINSDFRLEATVSKFNIFLENL